MKDFNTLEELVEFIGDENYYYNGNDFNTLEELKENANKYFNSVTEDYEDRDDYYSQFGVKVGECHIKPVKTEKYYIQENNTTATVHFYEGYIDSGVPAEDYFYGFYITEF